jgi:hypothetical protein
MRERCDGAGIPQRIGLSFASAAHDLGVATSAKAKRNM